MHEPIIETNDLVRKYGNLVAVDGIGLHVSEGSVYGFLGPNGAGKTTTIRMLLGLVRPTRGEVFLFGGPLNKDRLTVLSQVGAMVETPSLYSHLTGYENLEVTRRLTNSPPKSIEHALSIVGLQEYANRFVREYSQGMRQRLALALALLNEPKLLILDEPTNGLDPAGIREMRDLIKSFPIQFGVTVFLSSHLLAEVQQIASHIGIINKGKLLFQGTIRELEARRANIIRLTIDDLQKAVSALRAAGWDVKEAGNNQLSVVSKENLDAARINSLLVNRGINVLHLSTEDWSLESVFMELTGNPE
jgi:ABC-type multidrug transport system ATPase subunit